MMKPLSKPAAIAAICSLCVFAPMANAAPPVLKPGGGHIVARVLQDAHVHVEATRRALHASDQVVTDHDGQVPIRDSKAFMRKLNPKVRGATISVFEYTPKNPDAPPLRIHSRSGKSFEATFRDIVRAQNKSPSSGSESEAGASVSENEVAADAGDAGFYPKSSDLRALNRQKADVWVVEPSAESKGPNIGRVIHGTDAELKTLRQLEYEFQANPALARGGGTLVGYVSKTVCDSCAAAMEKFSDKYGVDTTVYYLDETGTPPEATLADTVGADIDAASKASSTLLRVERKRMVDDMLRVPLPGTARAAEDVAVWSDAYAVERIAAAEAGELVLTQRCMAE